MQVTIGCVQFAPAKAKVQENLDKIGEYVLQAAGEGADLVLFPESSPSGYFLEGGVLECALSADELGRELQNRLSGLDRPIDVALGFYEIDGKDLYNSAAYFEVSREEVRLVHRYRKFFLPTYGVFDEERFVGRGRDLGVFQTRFGTVGLLICEDVWHSILPALSAVAGATVLLVPSASPARGFKENEPDNLLRYDALLQSIAEEHGVVCVNAQLCGFEGGKGFIGGSQVVDPFGTVVGKGPVNEEHLLLCQLDLDLIPLARASSPLLSDLRACWGDISRIVSQLEH